MWWFFKLYISKRLYKRRKNMDNTLIEKQLKAAADLNRIKLLACMKHREVCVCDFVDVLGISQQR